MRSILFLAVLSLVAIAPAQAQWTRIDTNGLLSSGIFAVTGVVATPNAVHVSAGFNPASIYRSTDGGDSWQRVEAIMASSFALLADGATVVVQDGPNQRLYVSTDEGASWTARTVSGPLNSPFVQIARVEAASGRSHVFIPNTQQTKLYVTHDDFASAEPVLPDEGIVQVASNGSVLVAVTGTAPDARYFRSADGGRAWATVPPLGVGSVGLYAAGDSLFVSGYLNGFNMVRFGSADGATWVRAGSTNALPTVQAFSADHSAVFLSGIGADLRPGLFISVDNGLAFTKITNDFPSTRIGTVSLPCLGNGRFVAVTPRYAFALSTCDDAGAAVINALYRHDIEGATLTAAEEDGTSATGLRLDVPTPNPVRGRFTLSFSLEQSGSARLTLYDVLGRRVAELADGIFPAGENQVMLDVTGQPSGVYLLRLQAPGGVRTRSVVLLD